jgi:probable rRNA maturation factor
MERVFIYSADKLVNLTNRRAVKQAIAFLFQNENCDLERINYIFCSDKYLLRINKEFLNHSTLTDVITFSLAATKKPLHGEVYLSVERIMENAKSFKVAYQNELLRVMIHGALHLCGYGDKTSAARTQMKGREDYYLKEISFT